MKELTKYVLSQKVSVAVDQTEWIDICTDILLVQAMTYAKTLKKRDPNIVLALRQITETELEIE